MGSNSVDNYKQANLTKIGNGLTIFRNDYPNLLID